MLSGIVCGTAQAQEVTPPATEAQQTAPAQQQTQQPVIKSLTIEGTQRLEAATVLSYTRLRVGQPYDNASLDQAIKDLHASDLMTVESISGAESGHIVIHIRENPIINRVLLEGNKHLKEDKITPEIHLAPRQIFTRAAVRADVARIVELYRRQGRFAAVVEPQMVQLDQNRVDVVFEITEGPKSKVRQINIIGNEEFSDGELRGEMATKQARFWTILSSNTSYDQDRLAYDQQKLRQFYLTEGYADFRVVSAIAELTPDKRDFIITYVVEEGERYKFGPVTVDSAVRDFDEDRVAASLPFGEGDWYNAQQVEDAVEQLSELAGAYGYAFADVQPEFSRDAETRTMSLNFHIAEANRTYIERIEITGNTQTRDEVIRREFRVAEGDAFNSFMVRRSQDRINSLGYFQEGFEIEQKPGSSPDRIVLGANVEERPTGELTLSAGFSSLERFLVSASIRQRNFRGMGQTLSASVDYSSYSKSVELGFTEPYLFDHNIALGGTLYRRDLNAFNYIGSDRNTTYSQVSTGFQIVSGIPLTEYWTLSGRYNFQLDDVTLDEATFYTDGECDPLKAGRYYCDAIGERITSLIGLSLIFDSLNSRIRPSAGHRLVLGLDFAGLGGDVRYVRGKVDFDKYWSLGSGFIFSTSAEGGYIHSLEDSRGEGIDPVRITDRFWLGEPQFRGFDIRGVGPRVQRLYYSGDPSDGSQALITDQDRIVDDALGGKAYYLTKAELEIPLGAGAREMGLRPSIFVQAGALFNMTRPRPTFTFEQATGPGGELLYNDDGSPTLLPYSTPVTDANGNELYYNTYTNSEGAEAVRLTTCSVGYAADPGDPCVGSASNTAYLNTTQPFFERYVGDTARPRITVGIGVNWNSPFGPLRLDIAKAILTQPGDDPKLVTFNVGTQF
ncbi:outer membrane protein assembly factor BamA [Sphingosinithalassobacter tenebrarum]|uniref:Outer membrane protein assembly factor BamA n=2 Tax=Stakelama tenebrarum TaxID=2711215 RepID=A0A6G6YAI0_9SPHN|nr:outer membrane protein assembly factor BamA [Sphingosinithalassobacter tenebrarum]